MTVSQKAYPTKSLYFLQRINLNNNHNKQNRQNLDKLSNQKNRRLRLLKSEIKEESLISVYKKDYITTKKIIRTYDV